MNKKYSYLSLSFGIIVMISAFLDIPYINNYFLIIGSVLAIVLLKYLQRFTIEKEIKECEKIDEFKGIGVYLVTFRQMGNHNVALIRIRKGVNFILIEEGLMKDLDDKERKAAYYHELGHLHTISSGAIFIIQTISLLFSTTGLHSMLHGNKSYLLVIIGTILFIFLEWLKRYVEYDADKKAILLGALKEDLISAISKIEEMNSKYNKIVMSGHPQIKKRIKRINKI